MEQKKGIIAYIQDISLFLLGILFFVFPVIFATVSTNPLFLPKQLLLGTIVGALLILQAVKVLAEKTVKLRRTPFDIPIILFAIVAFLSSIFAVNQMDALMAFFPFFFAILGFFLIINIAKDRNSFLFLASSLIAGSVLLSILAVLSFFKVYVLPFAETHIQTFTPLGSLLEQEIYLVLACAVSSYCFYRLLRSKPKNETVVVDGLQASSPKIIMPIAFGIASFIILMGIVVTTYSLININRPLILPIETGFQTAFSEISLDTGRVAQGFLLGSGIGTYATDFSRWKQASFNQNQDLWSFTFFRSSNYVLELLATTGILGLCAFLFLLIRVAKEIRLSPQNKIVLAAIGTIIASLLLPLNFSSQTLMFFLLSLFAINQGLLDKNQNRYFDIELQIVAFKKGLISMETPHAKSNKSLILPSIIAAVIFISIGVIGYFSYLYVSSDLIFQKSLIASSQNNGTLTYQLQAQAISMFPYRDGFYRVFSQTNFALANSLASQQKAGSTPDQTVQQNITTLIQQSINAARNATAVAPQTNLNWQNLSSIYRGLIGFGQNAETFAIASAQQSISLNPNNPQEYINLGGIYYQLQQWEGAQNQFQIAISLKPDYANAYYNLGHVLEQKGDLQNALVQYQTVRSLVSNDKASLTQIDKEIAAVQGKAQPQADTNTASAEGTTGTETLKLSEPKEQLPEQNPQVEIPAPDIATESSK